MPSPSAVQEVHRVPAGGVSGHGIKGLPAYEAAALGGVALREHVLHPGLHVAGVGHVGLGVDKGQLHRLYYLVICIAAVPLPQLQALEDVQGHEHGYAVAVGGHLKDLIALVIGA